MAWPPNVFWEVTHFFQTVEASGWSEKQYWLQDDHTLDVKADVLSYSTERKKALNENITITHVRLSDPGKVRDQILITDPGNFGIGNISGQPMAYESALLYRLEFADNIVNTRLLHGFTEGDMGTDGFYLIGGPTGIGAGAVVAEWIATKMQSVNQVATGNRPTPYTPKAMQAGYVSHFRSHDIGRPFGLRRGRASPTP